MQQEMKLTSPMQHENGPMRLNVVNDVVKLTLLSEMTYHNFVTCLLSHGLCLD